MKKIEELGNKDIIYCLTEVDEEAIMSVLTKKFILVKLLRGSMFVMDDSTCGGTFFYPAWVMDLESARRYYVGKGYSFHEAWEFMESGEAAVLPEQWAIWIDNQEVIDVVGKWLDKGKRSNYTSLNIGVVNGDFFVYPAVSGLWHVHPMPPVGYTRISLEQFKEVYPPIKEGDWVYYRCGDAWEAVMQFDYEIEGVFHGTHCFSLSEEGEVEYFKIAHTRKGIRLATQEELSRIRDAYSPPAGEFDDLIKELEHNLQEPPAGGWKSPAAEIAADQWNEALKLAINLLKDKQKI